MSGLTMTPLQRGQVRLAQQVQSRRIEPKDAADTARTLANQLRLSPSDRMELMISAQDLASSDFDRTGGGTRERARVQLEQIARDLKCDVVELKQRLLKDLRTQAGAAPQVRPDAVEDDKAWNAGDKGTSIQAKLDQLSGFVGIEAAKRKAARLVERLHFGKLRKDAGLSDAGPSTLRVVLQGARGTGHGEVTGGQSPGNHKSRMGRPK